MKTFNYFPAGCAPVGCDMQEPVVDSSGKAHTQPLAQGFVLLQVPRQAKAVAPVRNWRAETVPAQAAAATIVVNNAILIILCVMAAAPLLVLLQPVIVCC